MIRGVTLIELLRREYAPRKLHLSQGSLDNYRRAVNSLQRHWEREISVAELNEELILPWLKQRLKQAAPKTGMPQVLALHDEVIVALAGVHHRERELVCTHTTEGRSGRSSSGS